MYQIFIGNAGKSVQNKRSIVSPLLHLVAPRFSVNYKVNTLRKLATFIYFMCTRDL